MLCDPENNIAFWKSQTILIFLPHSDKRTKSFVIDSINYSIKINPSTKVTIFHTEMMRKFCLQSVFIFEMNEKNWCKMCNIQESYDLRFYKFKTCVVLCVPVDESDFVFSYKTVRQND